VTIIFIGNLMSENYEPLAEESSMSTNSWDATYLYKSILFVAHV
jgi:hypothetical protein